jgi:hypothetical protein
MGAGKGIRTCALLDVTDHRYLCPAPSVGAKAGPYNGTSVMTRIQSGSW